jgi:hypothetical protein
MITMAIVTARTDNTFNSGNSGIFSFYPQAVHLLALLLFDRGGQLYEY